VAKVSTIKIGRRVVGPGHPVYIIAEAGVNHNGSFQTAVKLAETAKECGADAVKFQTFKADKLVSRHAAAAAYQRAGGYDSQLDMLRRLELSFSDFGRLKDRCDRMGLDFLSTPFDEDSLDFLVKLGVKAVKIGSGDLTNNSLLAMAARSGRPLILSTGMATDAEIRSSLRQAGTCKGGVCLLHCVSLYPAPPEEVNLRAVTTLRNTFKLPVGFSDHTTGIAASIGAVALGACLIERHFTLDANSKGPDHKASLEPRVLKEMIDNIHELEKAMLGSGEKVPGRDESDMRKYARRSIVAAAAIPRGTVMTRDNLALKRPGTGLPPACVAKLLGRRAKRDIAADEIIRPGDFKI
jgi:N,N'-diacetyllegionaminate synthase